MLSHETQYIFWPKVETICISPRSLAAKELFPIPPAPRIATRAEPFDSTEFTIMIMSLFSSASRPKKTLGAGGGRHTNETLGPGLSFCRRDDKLMPYRLLASWG